MSAENYTADGKSNYFFAPEKFSARIRAVNPNELRLRRATVDDLPALKAIWLSMQLPTEPLENRLTDFQVVERDGEVVGAIGFQIVRTAARLYGEGYSDFSVADAARELFWDRAQKLAANLGVFRLWTQDNSPFWRQWGFQPASDESFARLPDEWKSSEGKWLTLELKNEAVVSAALAKQFGKFSAGEKRQTNEAAARAKKIFNLIAAFFFLVGFAALGIAGWLFLRFRNSHH